MGGLGQLFDLLAERKHEILVEAVDLGVVLLALFSTVAKLQKRLVNLLELLHHLMEEGYEVLFFELVHIGAQVNHRKENELERVGKQVHPILHHLPPQGGTPEVGVFQKTQRLLEVKQMLSSLVE